MSKKQPKKTTTVNQTEQSSKKTRKELLDDFVLLEAVTPEKALSQNKFGFNWQENIELLTNLENKGIIKHVGAEDQESIDRYYYDITTKQRKKDFFIRLTAIIIPGIIFILLGIVWLLSIR